MADLKQEFFNFLALEKRYSAHTILSYQTDLTQFSAYFLKEFNKEKIEEAAHFEIRGWLVSLISASISARSVNRKISTLKSFYKFLQKKEVIKISPMLKVISPKTAKKLPAFVDEKQMEFLLDTLVFEATESGYRAKVMLEILYATGIRRAELLQLKTTDVDEYNLQIKVLGKGNKERIIPIKSSLLKELEIYKNSKLVESLFLFSDEEGKQLKPHHVYLTVKKYLTQVTTLEKKSPHVMRHTFATHLMNNGADINAVKELLGHASLAATQVYTHNTIEKLKNIYKQAHPRGEGE